MKYILFSSKSYNIVNVYQGKNYALYYGLNCALMPQIHSFFFFLRFINLKTQYLRI